MSGVQIYKRFQEQNFDYKDVNHLNCQKKTKSNEVWAERKDNVGMHVLCEKEKRERGAMHMQRAPMS